MIKVLYVLNDTIKYGGTEAVVLNYYNHMDRNEISIDFMIHTTIEEAESNERVRALKATGAKVFVVTPRRISVSRNIKEIRNILANNKYDIVHSHCDSVNYLILKLAKKAGIKVRISHSHNTAVPVRKDSYKDYLHDIYLYYCRTMIRYAATDYMACSKEAAEWLHGRNTVNDNYILKNAIDTERYKYDKAIRDEIRKALDIHDDEIVIGNVGAFRGQKNHIFLLKLFSKLNMENSKYRLLLVGDGELRSDIEEYAYEYGIGDKVIIYGETSFTQKLYQGMDVFVFPSLFEGLSVALIEAQCSGLKCLVNDIPQISKESFLTDEITSLECGNLNIWTDAILNCNYNTRQSYSEVISEKGYDIVVQAKKLEEYYKSKV